MCRNARQSCNLETEVMLDGPRVSFEAMASFEVRVAKAVSEVKAPVDALERLAPKEVDVEEDWSALALHKTSDHKMWLLLAWLLVKGRCVSRSTKLGSASGLFGERRIAVEPVYVLVKCVQQQVEMCTVELEVIKPDEVAAAAQGAEMCHVGPPKSK